MALDFSLILGAVSAHTQSLSPEKKPQWVTRRSSQHFSEEVLQVSVLQKTIGSTEK